MPKIAKGSQVTVHLGGSSVPNTRAVNKIVASTLGRLGCGECFSGFDIRFTHIDPLIINPRTHEVAEQQFG